MAKNFVVTNRFNGVTTTYLNLFVGAYGITKAKDGRLLPRQRMLPAEFQEFLFLQTSNQTSTLGAGGQYQYSIEEQQP